MVKVDDDFTQAFLKDEDRYEGKDLDVNIAAGMLHQPTGIALHHDTILIRALSSSRRRRDRMVLHTWSYALVCVD